MSTTQQFQDFVPVGRLVSLRDQSHHCRFIRKLNDGVTRVGGSAVHGVEGVEQRAQQTTLWGACAYCVCGGQVVSQFVWGQLLRKSLIQE